jgi:hypothetical protein
MKSYCIMCRRGGGVDYILREINGSRKRNAIAFDFDVGQSSYISIYIMK